MRRLTKLKLHKNQRRTKINMEDKNKLLDARDKLYKEGQEAIIRKYKNIKENKSTESIESIEKDFEEITEKIYEINEKIDKTEKEDSN